MTPKPPCPYPESIPIKGFGVMRQPNRDYEVWMEGYAKAGAEVEQIRLDERRRIQDWIDKNDVYKVVLGHYKPPLGMKWIPIQTKQINLMEDME